MLTHEDVLALIKAALGGRPPGTQVQVADHEAAEIAILNYIEQVRSELTGGQVREAHGNSKEETNCILIWNQPFDDINYSFVINGFDSKGSPVPVSFIQSTVDNIEVLTATDATLYAIAFPYKKKPDEIGDPDPGGGVGQI